MSRGESSRKRKHLHRHPALDSGGRIRRVVLAAASRRRVEKDYARREVASSLVEDNLVNQKVVLAILRKKGYRIDVASDGREALSKLDASLAASNKPTTWS